MEEKLCMEKHIAIKETLDTHNVRLNDHSKRIDALEQDGREVKTEVKNLCKSVDSLINTIKWGLGIFVTVCICVVGFLK